MSLRGKGWITSVTLGCLLAATATAGCGGGDGGDEGEGNAQGTGGNDVGTTGSSTTGNGGATSTSGATGGATGSATGGTTGSAKGGATSTAATGGSSGVTVCIGKVTGSCKDELCDMMAGCEVSKKAVCGGTADPCSDFDENAKGCAAQWGCSMAPAGLCQAYEGTECWDFNSESDCGKVTGCWWASIYCNGDIVNNCDKKTTSSACNQNPACYWSAMKVDYCQGRATACGSMAASNTCEMQSGCKLTPATCSGTPKPCEELTGNECLLMPGCRLASGGTAVITPTGSNAVGPDLVFSKLTAVRRSINASASVYLTVEELNRANVLSAIPHVDRVYLSTDDKLDDEDYAFADFTIEDSLMPYGLNSVAGNLTFAMPAADELEPGEYYVIGVVDAELDVGEIDETNNVFVVPDPIYVGPDFYDLGIDGLKHGVTKDVAPGDALQLSFTVENLSTLTVPKAPISVYFSADEELDETDTALSCEGPLSLDLATGASGTFTLDCTAPRARGKYYVLAELDPKDTLPDSDRDNNLAVAAPAITIAAPSPDLTVTAISSDSYEVEWKGKVTLTATVTNEGADPAPASTVSFITNGKDVLCKATVPALAAGASAEATKECSLPGATYGQVTLDAHVDADDALYEADESNNQFSAETDLTVTEPDINLVASTVSFISTEAKAGEKLNVQVTLANEGTDDAPPFQLIVYASKDASISSADTEFCIRDITSGLPAGSSANPVLDCTVVTLDPGDYYLGMILDTEKDIPETSENDNVSVDSLDRLTIAE